MTSTSDRPPRPGSLYSRFIPREELHSFKTWMPGSFEPTARPPAAPPPDLKHAEHVSLLEAARAAAREEGRAEGQRQGYEDGYRDGLAALESFKQHHSAQMAAQVGALLQSIDQQFQAMEQPMAQAVAEAATRLARAVLRTELDTRPELVRHVAMEAVGAMLAGARQLRVTVHPEDEPLVAAGAGALLEARGARLVASAGMARGGCVVESELGRVDARIEQRWAQATQLLGTPVPWEPPPPAPAATAAAPAPARPEPEFELELPGAVGAAPRA
ncbi:FliH/SctL family protein [Azohydromonas caseinilytica]|uniref:Flagellar assembly protein FliH n=1 Tax=Azohydromonas caseinilytica TaxID=2728836 RepID=A0A848F5J1_9BURK|nr:flagellar assembly protein FliH [Azohydromonas caseinilytica]NML14864.1 flagellar biosynthesis protein [Azohydromonas caseinilytica]